MHNPPSTRSFARLSSVALPLGILVVAGWALFDEGVAPLKADEANILDGDDDGLPDAVEVFMGTNSNLTDSDQDGFSDVEEFARQSDPANSSDVPEDYPYSVGMTAYGHQGFVHVIIAIYDADRRLGNNRIRFGAIGGRKSVTVPVNRLMGMSTLQETVAADGSEIKLIDMRLRHGQIAPRYFSVYVALGMVGVDGFQSASKLDLMRSGDVVLMGSRESATWFGLPPDGSGAAPDPNQQGGSSTTSVYSPISVGGGGEVPSDWASGQVCSRSSMTVGSTGAVLTQQVETAECVDGWDSHCDADCSDAVGSTYRAIDPVALVGG